MLPSNVSQVCFIGRHLPWTSMFPLRPRHRASVCAPALSCPIRWLPTIELATFFRPSPSCWSSGPLWPSLLPETGVGCRELVDKRWGWEFDVQAEGCLRAPTLQRCALHFSERSRAKARSLCCHRPPPTPTSSSASSSGAEKWFSLRGIILFLSFNNNLWC